MQRLTPFGFPLRGRPQQSSTTVRMVPLTQGMSANRPFTNEPPGSASSLMNYLPMNGILTPRSRLSSIGTLPRAGLIFGMTEMQHTGSVPLNRLWVVASGSTVTDNLACLPVDGGTVSQASFVSSHGIGTKPDWTLAVARPSFAQYPSVFDPSILDDILLIGLPRPIGSATTILAAGITAAGVPTYSYLTGAPPAKFVISFDNYVVAWNVMDGSTPQQRRAQWPARGDPGNWTGPGSGFEDLLSMKGIGTGGAVLDSRLVLFSSQEIWLGIPSSYPSQFQFSPLDTTVGLPYGFSGTVVNTELGIIFLGSDRNLRLLPRGGGLSVIINPSLGIFLRDRSLLIDGAWGQYDEDRRLYHLRPVIGGSGNGIVLNLNTGEWGEEFTQLSTTAGCYAASAGPFAEKSFSGDVQGRLYSDNSLLRNDQRTSTSQFTVTSKYRSEPVGLDLPDGQRQIVRTNWAYRATSAASGVVSLSGDYGNTFPPQSSATVNLSVASYGQNLQVDRMVDGPAPVVEWTSDTTGYELHRASVTMALRGRL